MSLFSNSTFTSKREQFNTGTLTLVPFILPFNSGKTEITDEDAPVVCGIILFNIERFVLDVFCKTSTAYCHAVVA